MKLAYVIAPGRGKTNLLLAGVADALKQQGFNLCGTVQLDTERAEEHHCDMDVLVLPDGPKIRISQFLGTDARGCKLNPEALETSVAQTQDRLKAGADLLIVNKFGKQEAEGRGFREAVGEALANDIPAIIGVSQGTRDAFMTFVGAAQELAPDHNTIMEWALGVAPKPA
jgi:nucleoside-triphosphatase THEP1